MSPKPPRLARLPKATRNAARNAAIWLVVLASWPIANQCVAQTPEAQGFKHFYKCRTDADMTVLGDTRTPQACRQACEAQSRAAGCWWLDGTGGFARQCRVCRTLSPTKGPYRNDWALPMLSALIA